MRASTPVESGSVERDGVAVHWERFGSGEPAILFLHADPIVESGMWKAQVPWFSRRHTVITFDPRGNGGSDRPRHAAAYADGEFIEDAVAVLDANGIARAVVVSVCQGAGIAIVMAARHPERVAAVVAVNPALNFAAPHPHRAPGGFDNEISDEHGWAKENRHYWRRDWRGYCEFFFDQLLPEPHSTKQLEDCVAWSQTTTAETMLAYRDAPPDVRHDPDAAEETCRRVRCPVLVILGTEDRCQPNERGRRAAEYTGGELLVLDGAGHLPFARDPVKVNLAIADFLDRRAGQETATA